MTDETMRRALEEWRIAWKAYLDASDAYNSRLELARSERKRGNWSMKLDVEYKAIDEIRGAEFIAKVKLYEALAATKDQTIDHTRSWEAGREAAALVVLDHCPYALGEQLAAAIRALRPPAGSGDLTQDERVANHARTLAAMTAAPSPDERAKLADRALRALIHFAACAHDAMDNSEEIENGNSIIGKPYWDVLCAALDILDELPDQPGYIMSPPAKAQWALRDLTALRTTPAPDSSKEK